MVFKTIPVVDNSVYMRNIPDFDWYMISITNNVGAINKILPFTFQFHHQYSTEFGQYLHVNKYTVQTREYASMELHGVWIKTHKSTSMELEKLNIPCPD